jgi:hypothetical protein
LVNAVGESVKERIINAAQSDPFRSVEEIARHVGTTQQYVRTILSESGYSLTRLRREYVKQMERRLGQAPPGPEPFVPSQGKLEIRQIAAPSLARLLNVPEDAPLFQASRAVKRGEALGLGQLVTALPMTLKLDCGELRELLPVTSPDLAPQKHWAVVVPAPKALQELLGLERAEPVFRLGTLWESQGSPAAVEFFWVPADGCVLTWHGQASGPTLEAYGEAAYR